MTVVRGRGRRFPSSSIALELLEARAQQSDSWNPRAPAVPARGFSTSPQKRRHILGFTPSSFAPADSDIE